MPYFINVGYFPLYDIIEFVDIIAFSFKFTIDEKYYDILIPPELTAFKENIKNQHSVSMICKMKNAFEEITQDNRLNPDLFRLVANAIEFSTFRNRRKNIKARKKYLNRIYKDSVKLLLIKNKKSEISDIILAIKLFKSIIEIIFHSYPYKKIGTKRFSKILSRATDEEINLIKKYYEISDGFYKPRKNVKLRIDKTIELNTIFIKLIHRNE